MSESPSALLEVHRIPIHLTASPDLVGHARACVADGSISDPETPALLRRTASLHLVAVVAYASAIEYPVPPRIPVAEGFVLVDYEVRPGVRSYRLARIPANDSERIRIGAFERHVHRTLVLFVRRLVWYFTGQMALAPEGKGILLTRTYRLSGSHVRTGSHFAVARVPERSSIDASRERPGSLLVNLQFRSDASGSARPAPWPVSRNLA
jgi:hypothetical protein